MHIVADAGVIAAAEACADLGQVEVLPTAGLTHAAVRDPDVLLVRSTTRVDAALLGGSRVRFVATATIGIDHMDIPWLESNGIAWASAPGCNADSVVQWVAAALLALAARTGRDVATLRLGIVGVGAVGSRVARLCAAAGLPAPLLCDPPRARAEGDAGFVPLDDVLAGADVLTFHVPLLRSGADATVRLADAARLARMRPGAWLLNASRGEVVDGAALLAALGQGHVGAAALDVWEGEPTPSPELVRACAVATAHIAGHSLEGKYEGTRLVYDALCRWLGIAPEWRPALPPAAPVTIDTAGKSDAVLTLEAARAGYRIDLDTTALSDIVSGPAENRGLLFRTFRQNYPERREISGTPIACHPPLTNLPPGWAQLGVRLR